MAEKHKYFVRKKRSQKVGKTAVKESANVKILNTEQDKLDETDFNTLVLNVRIAASAFKNTLRRLTFKDDNDEINALQKKEILKELADIQNMIKLKILSLKNAEINKTEGESVKAFNKQSNTESLHSFESKVTSKRSSSHTRAGDNYMDSKSEAFRASKLKTLSKQSLCSSKSSLNDYSFVADDDDDGFDEVNNGKFKEFILKVNCPFCLKLEDNKDSLAKHLDTACSAFKTKIFVQNLDCPYSVFQLLPNNAFKCNICPDSVHSNVKKYFMHSQDATHISGYNKAVSRKNYTDLIFCASCKIQFPNNATQILFHLEHKVHERNRKDLRSSHFFRQKDIHCVYSKEKKFKCLICPPAKCNHKSVKEILLHVESEAHLSLTLSQNRPQRKYTIYCMFCLEEINVFCILGHINSSEHSRKEEEENKNEFQLCFYCGFTCAKLLELARHTEACLDKIRQKDNLPKSDKVLGEIEKDQERTTKENTCEKGRSIIVKGNPKILEVYHYFKQFGKINDIEPHGENTIMITFEEEKTVDNILESEKPIEINGMILKITRKEDLDHSDVKVESSRAAEATNPFFEGSNDEKDHSDVKVESSRAAEATNSFFEGGDDENDLTNASHDDFGVSSPTVECFSNLATESGTLESLFNRVSSHLSNTALKPDCEDFLSIAGDCSRILKLRKCSAIGFSGCGLTFPVEKLTLYCELSIGFIKEDSPDDKSTSLTESVLFNENLCEKCASLFENSDVFSRVKLRGGSFPLLEFYHNKTQKLCTITFRQSDNILSEELRYCLKDNEKLHSFVLIIRFWLTVHRLEIREFEPVIISLLLFFLLSSKAVNAPSENFRKKQKDLLVNFCETIKGSKRRYQNIGNEYSITKLFQNFLLFLNDFDFEDMAICLPLLHPVPKTRLLQEPLKKYLCRWFYSDAPVWIMDPFLFNNVAADVKKADWDLLLKIVRETIGHYHISAET